jgi:orotidine 5'-phosphate decarboxylase subfamily 2
MDGKPGCWERITEAADRNGSLACVGLDIEMVKIPEHLRDCADPLYRFGCAVVDATLDLVCCYKPNIAFYEAEGIRGLEALEKTIRYIDRRVPVILDAKRGDIGNTAEKYARAAFEWLGADALTVNPYMGWDSIAPYLKYEGRGIFLLCLTSNASSTDFQSAGQQPLYMRVAEKAREWNEGRDCIGLVVGATHPEQVLLVREAAQGVPFLLPGIGAQGGSLESVETAARGGGRPGVIVNASRSVIFAGNGNDFEQKIRAAAEKLKHDVGGPRGRTAA